MIKQRANFPQKNMAAVDEIYLTEMGNRIAKMRALHNQMEKKWRSWDWLKGLTQQG